eukprot:g15904.t1
MVTTELLEIDSCQLMQLLVETQLCSLVLDCRSFLSFNASHIRGSHNVYCNSIVKRRSKAAIALDCILTEESVRTGLSCGRYHTVVVLDGSSSGFSSLAGSDTAKLVLSTLSSHLDASRVQTCFLK